MELLQEALSVRTPADLDQLWKRLGNSAAPFTRPIGDRWGNRGLFTAAGGNSDHKLVELVTNMHDAVVLAEAERRHPGLDSNAFSLLFPSPKAAVTDLFAGCETADLAGKCEIELHDAGGQEADDRRHRTLVFRDFGIGMTAAEIPGALFRLGSSRKDGVLWQLGAFGRGGLTVLPSCYGWVVVTRRQPDLLDSDSPDEIAITVVRWQRIGNRQTETAIYRVTRDWPEFEDAFPPSVSASVNAHFEPGTYVAVVAFQAEGIWVSRLGDERSVDTLLDTRLFEPVLPTLLRAPVFGQTRDRATILRGLGRHLDENPRDDRHEGREVLPFRHDGRTHLLPIRFYVFQTGDVGARRRFVAKEHALVLNSNGQVHAHWTPAEFRARTRLNKLADRILVVVDTDDLSLPLRTTLFTADRTALLRNDDSVRLEEELISFLDDWDALRAINNSLIRESILRSNVGRSTLAVSERIGRALQLRSSTPRPTATRSDRTSRQRAPVALLEDPTEITAPLSISAARGRTKGIYFTVNGPDGFVPRRVTPKIRCSLIDLDATTDVTVGELKDGRLRVAVAVPPDAEITEGELELVLDGWLATTGGLGPRLSRTIRLLVIDSTTPTISATDSIETEISEDSRSVNHSLVALLWTNDGAEEGWTSATVGAVEYIPASILAEANAEYASLAEIDADIPVIKLNETYSPLRLYTSLRSRDVGDEGVARAKDRYALGVGVELVILEQHAVRLRNSGDSPSEEWLRVSTIAAARGVLAVLPDFDVLVAHSGLEDL